jgi:hypothetical protein
MKPLAERFLPGASHAFLAPLAGAAAAASGSDLIVAWSLGAWRVLDDASRGNTFPGRVWLLAPFLAFCAEDNLGGKVSRTQTRWLRRWMQRDPAAALEDFRQRAGLEGLADGRSPLPAHPDPLKTGQPTPAPLPELPYGTAELLGGLDALAEPASPALRAWVTGGLPIGWRAAVGGADPLLDGAAVCRAIPGCALARNATHEPAALLAAVKD